MVANYRPLRAPVYFTCLAQSSDPDLGTVTGSGKYLVGETVTLTAQPGERADFAGWMDEEGQLVSQESRYSFSITQDIILTAQFVRIYAVLVSVEPEGSGTVQGAGNYRQGQEAVLAAQESEGWLFTAWTEQGETVEASPEYRFVVDRDRTLAARFAVGRAQSVAPNQHGSLNHQKVPGRQHTGVGQFCESHGFVAGDDVLGHRETDIGHSVQPPGLHGLDVDLVGADVVLGLVPEPGVSRQQKKGCGISSAAALVIPDFFLDQHDVLIVS